MPQVEPPPTVVEIADAYATEIHGTLSDDAYTRPDRALVYEALEAAIDDDRVTAYSVAKVNGAACVLVLTESGGIVARVVDGVGEAFVLGPLTGVLRERAEIENGRVVATLRFSDPRVGTLDLDAPRQPEPAALDRPNAVRRHAMATEIRRQLRAWASVEKSH